MFLIKQTNFNFNDMFNRRGLLWAINKDYGWTKLVLALAFALALWLIATRLNSRF